MKDSIVRDCYITHQNLMEFNDTLAHLQEALLITFRDVFNQHGTVKVEPCGRNLTAKMTTVYRDLEHLVSHYPKLFNNLNLYYPRDWS